ncbi:hypothetical protein F0562_027157 [Nyssa sinensis]|uniref:GAGA-binding transcriptional activator n=1 Tax=Nyssa sinensis TaxID=561372 RepID=A0A5J5B491_9ASTE|nr:hypothetical protein F0562_027157 [Nyssa sinensis]
MHISDALPMSPVASEPPKSRRTKRTKEAKAVASTKKDSKSSKKVKREGEDLNKMMFGKSHEWKDGQDANGGGDDLNKQLGVSKPDWKDQDLGLNQVAFDDSTMPVPVCSCTGVLRPCYKWGNGALTADSGQLAITTGLSPIQVYIHPNLPEMSVIEEDKKVEAEEAVKGGELLFCGPRAGAPLVGARFHCKVTWSLPLGFGRSSASTFGLSPRVVHLVIVWHWMSKDVAALLGGATRRGNLVKEIDFSGIAQQLCPNCQSITSLEQQLGGIIQL